MMPNFFKKKPFQHDIDGIIPARLKNLEPPDF